MGTNINAIETHYAGCRFRSRLEARWAVFFDALKIEWQYEPQGFEFSSPYPDEKKTWRYLPDFYLPGVNKWVEVKGDASAISGDYGRMLYNAIDWRSTPLADGLLLLGDIPNPTGKTAILHSELYCRKGVAHGYAQFAAWGSPVVASEWPGYTYYADCRTCEEDGLPPKATPKHVSLTLSIGERGELYQTMGTAVEEAYLKARRARFEHGETPTPPHARRPVGSGARPADAARAEMARRRSSQPA